MSNNKTHRSTKLIQYAFGMLLLLGGGQALASTAANHIVENTVPSIWSQCLNKKLSYTNIF